MLTNKELLFIFSCFAIGSIFLLLSSPLIISTDVVLMLFGFVLLFFSQFLELHIGGLRFTLKAFSALYLLLFLSPESVGLLSVISLLLNTRNIRSMLLRMSFEFLQFSVGIFFYRHSPNDYLNIFLFALGYFITNTILSQIFVKYLARDSISKYMLAFSLILILGVYSSAILTVPYMFSEITLGNLIFATALYVGFLIQLYYTVTAEIWHQELKLEKDQVGREIANLMKLPEVILESRKADVDKVLSDMLALAANITGYEYALLNLFDYKANSVLRIAYYGISDEAFNDLKERKPNLKETLLLMQQRFDVGGAYFIPKGGVDLDEIYTYKPSDYTKIDSENAWDPDDLFLVPINQGGRMIGYISFDKPKNMFRPTKREIEMSKFFAWQIGEVLSESKYAPLFSANYRREQSLSKFMDELSKNISTGTSFVLAYLDIDQFKAINFRNGFEYGDEIIREIRNTISDEIKNLGIFSQIGDEFLILLWSKSKSDGVLVSEKVISQVRQKFENISISAGVVKYPTDASTLEEVLDKVQTALITAKKSGGGRVITI